MLDQNTDRMWYVIGAVIVGAAIIFLMNSSFPQLFASVSTVFTDKVEDVSETINTIGESRPQYSTKNLLFAPPAKNPAYDAKSRTYSYKVNSSPNIQHMFTLANSKKHIVHYGETLTLSYDIYSSVDTQTINDTNNVPLDKDGEDITAWNGNDNDNHNKRKVNGVVQGNKGVQIPANTWTTVTVAYTNDSPKNVNQLKLRDYTNVWLLTKGSEEASIQIRNVTGVYRR